MTCRPLTIGVDATAFQNPATGIARHIACILDQLQRIDTHNRYILFESRSSGYAIRNPLWSKQRIPGVGPLSLRIQAYLPFLLKRSSVDVFWAGRQFCPLFASRRIRIVATVHDFVYRRYPETMKPAMRLMYRFLVPQSLRRADRLVPVSHFVGRELQAIHPEIPAPRTTVIPNAHHGWTLPSDYRVSERQNFLFFAGNFEPRKNLLNLVKALEQLEREGEAPPLHLAGPPGWSSADTAKYIERSPVSKKIVPLGYVDDAALRRQYLTCRAFIFPSLYEGFGIPVLEALSQDCVVLTSRGTVMEEIVGSSARYFDPLDPKTIASTIAQVCAEDFKRGQPRAQAEDLLSQYTWEMSAQRLRKLFEQEGTHLHAMGL